MTMHEQLRAAMLAAQSTPITPEWVDAVADVETDSRCPSYRHSVADARLIICRTVFDAVNVIGA